VVTQAQRLPGLTSPSSTKAMKVGLSEKRSVTPKQAMKILSKNGTDVSETQAKEILDVMYFLAKLIVNHNFKKQEK
jgi:hypothetical protein